MNLYLVIASDPRGDHRQCMVVSAADSDDAIRVWRENVDRIRAVMLAETSADDEATPLEVDEVYAIPSAPSSEPEMHYLFTGPES